MGIGIFIALNEGIRLLGMIVTRIVLRNGDILRKKLLRNYAKYLPLTSVMIIFFLILIVSSNPSIPLLIIILILAVGTTISIDCFNNAFMVMYNLE
jgi:MFS-type transporter involved in bile tolerance (Atg22 family)